MSNFKVLNSGAGLGGLALAQSLVLAGIDFEVFERDKSSFDRPQGYRLHLDADAINAAREVLSPCLLAGLDGKFHYNKTLDRYEQNAEGVVAHFADGTTAQGRVFVGADGIRSAVRRQRAPQCDTVDAGITAIYGRVPINAAAPMVPKEALEDIFTNSSDDRKVFLGLGTVKFTLPPEEAAANAPGTAMRHQDDYVVCIVGGRYEFFMNDMRSASGEDLQRISAETIGAWPKRVASLIRAGDP